MTREEIEAVAMEVAADVLEHPDTKVLRVFDVADAIASRVADKLAHLTLSESERAMLRGLALDSRVAAAFAVSDGSDVWVAAHRARADLLDRLLGGSP